MQVEPQRSQQHLDELLGVDDLDHVALEPPWAELAQTCQPGDAPVGRVELQLLAARVHQGGHVVGDVDATVEVEDLVEERPTLDLAGLETYHEPPTQVPGVAQPYAAAPAGVGALRERRDDAVRWDRPRRLLEGGIDGGEVGPRGPLRRDRWRGLEGAGTQGQEDGVEDREQGTRGMGEQQSQPHGPRGVLADGLVRVAVDGDDAPSGPSRVELREEPEPLEARLGVDSGQPAVSLEKLRCCGALVGIDESSGRLQCRPRVIGVLLGELHDGARVGG